MIRSHLLYPAELQAHGSLYYRGVSTENAVETEVKIRVADWSAVRAAEVFSRAGLSVTVARLFEANFVFDTPDQAVRGAQMLLRLRRVGGETILTWKGPAVAGPHKSRPELEVHLDSFDTMTEILGHLGYRTYFRYEKYRTEFGGAEAGTATFDETPIGNFLELEGSGVWIDEMAARLGFGASDYVLDSYGKLYLAHCAKLGLPTSHMVFPFTS